MRRYPSYYHRVPAILEQLDTVRDLRKNVRLRFAFWPSQRTNRRLVVSKDTEMSLRRVCVDLCFCHHQCDVDTLQLWCVDCRGCVCSHLPFLQVYCRCPNMATYTALPSVYMQIFSFLITRSCVDRARVSFSICMVGLNHHGGAMNGGIVYVE